MDKIKAKIITREIEGQKVELHQLGFKADLKVVSEDDDKWIVEGYASVFGNVDSYQEVVDKGAFDAWIKEHFPRYPKFIWAHDWSKPLGPTLEVHEDEIGLFCRGELLKDVEQAREAYALIKSGAMTDLSFGFSVKEDSFDYEAGVRHLKQIAIYEWSPVLVGANPKATITGVKDDPANPSNTDTAPAAEPAAPAAEPAAAADPNPVSTDPQNPAPADSGDGKTAQPAEVKAGRVLSAKNISIVEAAMEAMQTAIDALEALLEAAEESGSASLDNTSVDQRGSDPGTMRVVKAILKDARKADKVAESVIIRAKSILNQGE